MDDKASIGKCELHPHRVTDENSNFHRVLPDSNLQHETKWTTNCKTNSKNTKTPGASDDLLSLLSTTKNEQTGTAPSSTDPYVEFSLMSGFFTDDVADMKDSSILDKYFTSGKADSGLSEGNATDSSKSAFGVNCDVLEGINRSENICELQKSSLISDKEVLNNTSNLTRAAGYAQSENDALVEIEGKPMMIHQWPSPSVNNGYATALHPTPPLPLYHMTRAQLPPHHMAGAPLPPYQMTRAPLPPYQMTRTPLPPYQMTRTPLPPYQMTEAPPSPYQMTGAPPPPYQMTGAPPSPYQMTGAPNNVMDYTTPNYHVNNGPMHSNSEGTPAVAHAPTGEHSGSDKASNSVALTAYARAPAQSLYYGDDRIEAPPGICKAWRMGRKSASVISEEDYKNVLQEINKTSIDKYYVYSECGKICNRERVRCPVCQVTIVTERFMPHIETHKPTPFQCTVCKSTPFFDDEPTFIYHMECHVNCTLRAVDTTEVQLLESLYNFQHKFPKYWEKIPSGGKLIEKFGNQAHVSGDPNEKVTCRICGKMVTNCHLSSHIRNAHRTELNFPCDICGKVYGTDVYLYKHKRVVHGERKHKCEYCDKGFTMAFRKRNHVAMWHSDKIEVQQLYKCDYCERSFPTRHQFTVHKARHEQSYFCEKCGKTFTTGSNLNQHLSSLAHQRVVGDDGNMKEVRTFLCEACGVSFGSKQHLRQHFQSFSHKKMVGEEEKYEIPKWRLKAQDAARKKRDLKTKDEIKKNSDLKTKGTVKKKRIMKIKDAVEKNSVMQAKNSAKKKRHMKTKDDTKDKSDMQIKDAHKKKRVSARKLQRGKTAFQNGENGKDDRLSETSE